MSVAVLYICTGKYIRFWDDFYRTAEACFLPGVEKHYFVFTDGEVSEQKNENVTKVFQKNLGWPDNTLRRFHMFLRAESQLAQFDYLYFFNANCRFHQPIGIDFLPEQDDQLLVVEHPGQIAKPADRFPYERNPRSRACIPYGNGNYYVCGGINGGRAETFLKFSRAARQAVDDDFRDGIVATWHDESHLNRYILDHPHTIRHAGYCYPQNWKIDRPKLIEVRDKREHGGRDVLRSLAQGAEAEDMVTVAVFGGLGNQMFQYAVGRALANRLGCRLQLDTRHYDKSQAFPYGLGHFAIDAIVGTQRTLPPSRSRTLKYFAWRHLSRGSRFIRENGLSFNSNIARQRGNVYLKGYWQSERYFTEYADSIRHSFRLVDPPDAQNAQLLDTIGSAPSIAVHVRRGDYVSQSRTNAFHGTCSVDYYRAAVAQVARRLDDEPTVYLFSDDLDWAMENLKFGFKTVPVGHNDRSSAHEDLRLMASCNHQVISNSTFSWWAAWLNPHPAKMVIAPYPWFADPSAENRDIIPEDWAQLPSHSIVSVPQAA